jgi:ABC-type branched-subunit amino acid transport system substrate-binding protein
VRSAKQVLVAVVVAGVVGTVATFGSSAGGAAALDDGVSADSIKIGYIFSKTGVAGSTFLNADKGCEARVDRENAKGGVNGRKIDVDMVDDQSANNKTAAQDLVQNKHVFMVVNNSSFAGLSGTYRWLLDNKIPMVNGGFDGTYYGEPGNEAIISALGNVVAAEGVTYDTLPKVMKQMGAKKVAALAYGVSSSSTAAATNLLKYAVPKVGLKPGYLNTTVDFGGTDVGPLVLGIKNSGSDAVYLPMVANSNLAVVQGLKQNGVPMKSMVLATGYGQPLLDQPVAKTLGPDVVLASGFAPVELKTKATKQFQADLKKYADYTGVPDFGIYTGYITCDLAIKGLASAGNPPTRAAFAPNLRKTKTYDQAGLACQPIDISVETYGEASPDACSYYVKIKDGKFVLFPPKGKSSTTPWPGKLIQQSTVATTTTTAPPA